MQKLLTPQDVADWFQIKISTVYQWTHQGFIPHVKMGKFVRFRASEVLAWLEKRSVKGRMVRGVPAPV